MLIMTIDQPRVCNDQIIIINQTSSHSELDNPQIAVIIEVARAEYIITNLPPNRFPNSPVN